ncbi:MAG TPA: sulfatase [Bryobacteraceae bacterium]|nr:sulfatase [Bryobacteraceae bacterium]
MKRRDLWKPLAAAVSAGQAHPQQRKRPNILFALADDWMWPFASIAGDKVVKTPTFDRVASKGVMFTNAFVSAPSCSPSRAAMLTGQWHWRLEEGANLNGVLPAKFSVYPDLLEQAGYYVGMTRKGWAPGNPNGGGRTRNPAGPRFDNFEAFYAARPKDKPFCFWFGSQDPHRPYEWESGVESGMRPEDVKVPPYLADSEITRKDICDYCWKIQRYDRETGAILALLEKAGELNNTIFVMSGDNGWPFPRGKATLYEAGTHVPLAVMWPDRIQAGRKVEDFVSLSDLAPTFLEVGGLKPTPGMTGRSLMNVLTSSKSGRVDPKRDHVLTGMERHVPCRGPDKRGYPMRALRTHDFHFIRNFHPERWPSGDPAPAEATFQQLAANTRTGYADVDAGPSKANMVTHREDGQGKLLFDLAFGKRRERELYDLRTDPYCMHNVAANPKYREILGQLDARLTAELKGTRDPRIVGDGESFDRYINMETQKKDAPGR